MNNETLIFIGTSLVALVCVWLSINAARRASARAHSFEYLLYHRNSGNITNLINKLFKSYPNLDALSFDRHIDDNREDQELKSALFEVLNHYETLAFAINERFYDEDILHNHIGYSTVHLWKICRSSVIKIRSSEDNNKIYEDFEALARRAELKIMEESTNSN